MQSASWRAMASKAVTWFFLSSARARVLSFRLLLILNIVMQYLQFLDVPQMVTGFVIMAHHTFMVFNPRKWVNAKVHIALVVSEIAASLYSVITAGLILLKFPGSWDLLPAIILGALNVATLCFACFCRLSSVRETRNFVFFAGCDASPTSQYTPVQVIFGRHAVMPLVRGEARAIVAARILILLGLCGTIPAFGIYVVFFAPSAAQVMIQDIKVSQAWYNTDPGSQDFDYFIPPQNITMVLLYMSTNTAAASTANVTVDAPGCTNVTISVLSPFSTVLFPNVTCPFPWYLAPPSGIVVAANFSDPWGALYVKPGQGDPLDVDVYTEPIPLMAGARLSVMLGQTARQIFSNNALDVLGFRTPLRTVSVNSVLVMQADTFPINSTDTVTLRLRPRQDIGTTRILKDFTDASVLSGLATLGGFWTFTNGAFTMFFGANLMYFLWRSRPLSALGLVHVFQRRALMRNWNADFPALRTEGGRPGSEEAGIVAFIRERLVSLDDPEPKLMDAEASTYSVASDRITIVEGGNVSERDS
ncbi:hypothetical protein B0H11DRAFT_666974 [Mycena galericulata]|nr:hypothetical protein B0H11DRAFT_666974 [Mycena galericulata]